MRKSTESSIVLLSRKGKLLRKLILQLSDDELMKLTPSPSEKVIKKLKVRILRVSRAMMTKN